ncbi:MAG: carboxylating nicotinate-nucleotide diphosphorylase [Elusimicrobium sp.]|jgi:nicotinate-nucleotide pyrophosphorylase (carboxylating)|nr:carboxylating nicotinate-nucleotide diphosphorylase [Elusimicrobium sp.]
MIEKIIVLALEEDLGLGDITSDNIFTEEDKASAEIIAKDDMVLCGVNIAKNIFNYVDPELKFRALKKDGDAVKKGETVIKLDGRALGILRAERVALNFMQRLSGVAAVSKEYTNIAKKYGVMVVDTRKSSPGMRKFDKYAVRCGGAKNHRMSLSDGVLIKDNHIAAAGSITKAVQKIRAAVGHTPKIEVETTNLKEVKEALFCKADIIMLDNMTPAQAGAAVRLINRRAVVEISGGVNKNNLEDYCKTGADVISSGALTHSVPAKDLSLKIISINRGLL